MNAVFTWLKTIELATWPKPGEENYNSWVQILILTSIHDLGPVLFGFSSLNVLSLKRWRLVGIN